MNTFWMLIAVIICAINLNFAESGKNILGSNGKTYYISVPLKKNFWQADRYCTYHNMTLVSIVTQEDEEAIQDIIQKEEYKKMNDRFFWIGATDQGSEGCFYWIGTGQPVIYSNWSNGQPDNAGGEHCGEISGQQFDYLWNDHHCDRQIYFICDVDHSATQFLRSKVKYSGADV